MLFGGAGDDLLVGDDVDANVGDDYLNGEDGNDTLITRGTIDLKLWAVGRRYANTHSCDALKIAA